MRSITIYCLVMFTLVVALTGAAEAKHPADGYQVCDLSERYDPAGGFDPSWSKNDLIFTQPKPAWDELTREERYIIAGLDPGSDPVGVDILPWGVKVINVAMRLFEDNGDIPAILTPDELRRLEEFTNVDDSVLEVYRNPLTGDWPLLKSPTPSPGNLYIRALTFDEMIYFAKLNPYYNLVWFKDADFGEDGEYVCSKLNSHIFYVRIYGWNKPIVETLQYIQLAQK